MANGVAVNGSSGKTSGKQSSFATTPKRFATKPPDKKPPDLPPVLPLTGDTDPDIQLGEDVGKIAKGWRLEENSNGYWRWRWQTKDHNGKTITYVNQSGKAGYKRGSQYVRVKDLSKAREEAKRA